MGVTKLPSIWDYLAGGADKAIGNYQDARQRIQAQQAQTAGLMSQLFGQGAVDSSQLQGALGGIKGMEGVKVQPNQAERQRQVIADPNKQWSDDELRAAGLPTTAERLSAEAGTVKSKKEIKAGEILSRWEKGETITEQEAAIAGLPTKQDMAQIRAAKADPILEKAAEQYIDQVVLSAGGRLTPALAAKISDQAYQQYVKDYQATGEATLTTTQLSNAKRYFSSRAIKLLNDQRTLDIQALNAQNRGNSSVQPADRMFAQISTLLENNRKTMADFLKANPGIEMMAGKPDAEVKPAFKGAVARYRRLVGREQRLQDAQFQLSSGVMPKDFAELLKSQVGGGAGVATFDEGKVAAALGIVKSGKGKVADLDEQVKRGRISQADADEVKRRLSATK